MSSILGVATLLTVLKTQGLMQQLSLVSTGSRGMRKLGSQFVNGVSAVSNVSRSRGKHVQTTSSSGSKPLVVEA